MVNDPIIEERLAALRARRPETAIAAPTADLLPPTGAPVELPAPLIAAHTDVAVDPVHLARSQRTGHRRSYPAGRARIGVTVAAAAGFLALVPVMGPLTAASAEDDSPPPDDEPATGKIATIPDGTVESTIDLTTTTTTPTSPETVVDPAATTTTAPAPPAGAPTVAAAPVAPSAPAPTPRGGGAPAPAPAPAAPAPAVPAPAAPSPAPVSDRAADRRTRSDGPGSAAAPASDGPPDDGRASPPPPPPPTTAPPPPTTSPS